MTLTTLRSSYKLTTEIAMVRKCLYFLLTFIICASQHVLADGENLMQNEIEHVIVVMLENRSFDNVLAWLYSQNDPPSYFIPSDTDPNFLGLSEDSLSQYTNLLKSSSDQLIFCSPPIKGIPSVISTPFVNSPKFDPNEPFPNVTNQIFGFDGGTEPTMSGFLQDYASLWGEDDWTAYKQDICAVMETYTDEQFPVIYGLAKKYAVSDLWFSSVPRRQTPIVLSLHAEHPKG